MILDSFLKRQDISTKKEFYSSDFRIGEIDTDRKFNVYNVPLELLSLNPKNSRLQTKLLLNSDKSFYYSKKGQKELADLIYKWNKDRNNKTERDIRAKGQQTPGLITADGLVINGNRRLCVMKRLYEEHKDDKYSKFKVVILDDLLSSDYEEIKKKEIQVQFGKDEAVGYRRIDTMLSMREFKKMTGWEDKKIKDYFQWDGSMSELNSTLKYIDDYLNFMNLNKKYDLVDGTEDQFKYLSQSHKKIEKNDEEGINWQPQKSDFNDYKYTFFKILRTKPSQHKIRPILKDKKIFKNKKNWINFKQQIEKIYEEGCKAVLHKANNYKKRKKQFTQNDLEKFFKEKTNRKMSSLLLDYEKILKDHVDSSLVEKEIDKIHSCLDKLNGWINNNKIIKGRKETSKKLRDIIEYVKEVKSKIEK